MFYVLFTYSKGQKEKDFRRFRSDDEVIKFIHDHYEKIDIVQIIGVERSYKLGLVETEDLVKSELIRQDIETDPFPDPPEESDRSSKQHAYLRNKEKESSAMEKIADEIEEEMEEETAEEKIIRKNKEALKRADEAIATAEKDLERTTAFIPKPVAESIRRGYKRKEDQKKNWPVCPECHKEKMAPWNKSDRCSTCQQYKKIPKKK